MSARPELSVEGILGPQGALARVLKGYEHRVEQLEMAKAVEHALAEDQHLLVEAGTGTGKTLAYLVPAARSGRRVVVSTATKTLQEQLFFRDVPLLLKNVGLAFDVAYLKGRANYLCLYRFAQFSREPTFPSRAEASRWDELVAWARRTPVGDRSELDLPDQFATWSRLSVSSDACLGRACPDYERCFVTRARQAAEGADVLIVNHQLFFADWALRLSAKAELERAVLPKYDAVVFDEAHALEDVATDHFGVSVSSHRVEELVSDALTALSPDDERAGLLSASALALRGRAETFFREAASVLGLSTDERRVRLPPRAFERLGSRLAPLEETLVALRAAAGDDEPELAALSRRADELLGELDFLSRGDSPRHVYWAEARKRTTVFRASPIDLGRELGALYEKTKAVVFTSATLTAQGRFDYFEERVGLAGASLSVRRLSLPSPFDFPRQAALFLPQRPMDPNAPGYTEAVAEQIHGLVQLTGGRAFCLFTSLRQMEAVHALLAHRLDWPVLLQGERPKQLLLDEFRAEPSVLFASHSFWEGVDVPGEALSLVIIDRLPFASPADPLVSARIDKLKAAGVDPFSHYQLPHAVIALRQGFGRLVRTREDRGIVAVLDGRLRTRAYGRVFLESLPPVRRFSALEPLARWFSGAAGDDEA